LRFASFRLSGANHVVWVAERQVESRRQTLAATHAFSQFGVRLRTIPLTAALRKNPATGSIL